MCCISRGQRRILDTQSKSFSFHCAQHATGAQAINETIMELHVSVEAAAAFEGEMQRLVSAARSIAIALECLRAAAGNRPIEVLRKESLVGFKAGAAARVLSHSYAAVVPLAGMPDPQLPLTPLNPGAWQWLTSQRE